MDDDVRGARNVRMHCVLPTEDAYGIRCVDCISAFESYGIRVRRTKFGDWISRDPMSLAPWYSDLAGSHVAGTRVFGSRGILYR